MSSKEDVTEINRMLDKLDSYGLTVNGLYIEPCISVEAILDSFCKGHGTGEEGELLFHFTEKMEGPIPPLQHKTEIVDFFVHYEMPDENEYVLVARVNLIEKRFEINVHEECNSIYSTQAEKIKNKLETSITELGYVMKK